MTSRIRSARRILGDFEKVSELRWNLPRGKTVGFRLLAEAFVAGATRVGGVGGWKSQNRKIVPLSLRRRTFKLKDNKKKFRTWTKKSSVFRVSRFLCSMYICNERPMYISHIHVYGYGTQKIIYIYIYRQKQNYHIEGMKFSFLQWKYLGIFTLSIISVFFYKKKYCNICCFVFLTIHSSLKNRIYWVSRTVFYLIIYTFFATSIHVNVVGCVCIIVFDV